jgi:tRNA(Ile2) C34 agmatinyltransferase TiaS
MLQSFTRNYEDNSTEAGFQFTFYCDLCEDGYKSSFIESETYKKGRGLRGLAQAVAWETSDIRWSGVETFCPVGLRA